VIDAQTERLRVEKGGTGIERQERQRETEIGMDTHNPRMNNNKHTASCPNHKHRTIEVHSMETDPSPQIVHAAPFLNTKLVPIARVGPISLYNHLTHLTF